jgi:alpha-beta hydrolase superfamily lysophospholipase
MTAHILMQADPSAARPRPDPALPAEPSALEKRVVGALVKALFFRGRRGGPWEPPLGMDVTEVRFAGNSGARLHGWHVRHAAPRAIVVLAHPDRRYGKQWFAREGWLSWLHGNAFDSLAFDFPVYGESRGGSTYLHDDVAAACRQARRLRPGLPVHVVGLSIGAFASLNAAIGLDFVEGLVLESPYPTFEAWYDQGGRRGQADRAKGHGKANSLLGRLFPKTYRRIDAGANAPLVPARRILVAGTRDDEVTPIRLTRDVAARLPADRTASLELEGVAHLGLFQRPEYREAVLSILAPAPRSPPAVVEVGSLLAPRALPVR